jgi:hypothetical protein
MRFSVCVSQGETSIENILTRMNGQPEQTNWMNPKQFMYFVVPHSSVVDAKEWVAENLSSVKVEENDAATTSTKSMPVPSSSSMKGDEEEEEEENMSNIQMEHCKEKELLTTMQGKTVSTDTMKSIVNKNEGKKRKTEEETTSSSVRLKKMQRKADPPQDLGDTGASVTRAGAKRARAFSSSEE